MPDPITNIIQKDTERLNRAREQFQSAFKAWDPFSPLAGEQQATVARLRREIELAEERLNQTFLAAPKELRLSYLKERLLR